VTWRAWAACWRGGAAYAGLGCAAALGFRGDWAAARVAGACVLLVFAAWVRRELLATRARMRDAPGLAARVADAAAAQRPVRIRGSAVPYGDDAGGGSTLLR
jgi:hypothetical protein